jgi:hypothetical protein
LRGRPYFSQFELQGIDEVRSMMIDDGSKARSEYRYWSTRGTTITIDWPGYAQESQLTLQVLPRLRPPSLHKK